MLQHKENRVLLYTATLENDLKYTVACRPVAGYGCETMLVARAAAS
jgi:hypothetical protein